MRLTIKESYDYRLYGIPYKERKKLEAKGYEMDVRAVIYEADLGDIIELYDLVTNQTSTYVKREDRLGKWVLAYQSGYIEEFGKSNLYGTGSFPDGVVAKII